MVLLIASDGSAFKVLQISMNSLRVRRFCIVSYLEMNDWGSFQFFGQLLLGYSRKIPLRYEPVYDFFI